ncbi:hypothetical protein GIB67_041780, partial [Kingdonia uniflora]
MVDTLSIILNRVMFCCYLLVSLSYVVLLYCVLEELEISISYCLGIILNRVYLHFSYVRVVYDDGLHLGYLVILVYLVQCGFASGLIWFNMGLYPKKLTNRTLDPTRPTR